MATKKRGPVRLPKARRDGVETPNQEAVRKGRVSGAQSPAAEGETIAPPRRGPVRLAKQVFVPVENRMATRGVPVEDRPTEMPCRSCQGSGKFIGERCSTCGGKGTMMQTLREAFPGLYTHRSDPGSLLQAIGAKQQAGYGDATLVTQLPCGVCDGKGQWRDETKQRMNPGPTGHQWWCVFWDLNQGVTPF